MVHCAGGPGAWAFGQMGSISNVVNTSSHNVLLSLVEWVEGGEGEGPDVIVGSVPKTKAERVHCRYPRRSIFNGESFQCTES